MIIQYDSWNKNVNLMVANLLLPFGDGPFLSCCAMCYPGLENSLSLRSVEVNGTKTFTDTPQDFVEDLLLNAPSAVKLKRRSLLGKKPFYQTLNPLLHTKVDGSLRARKIAKDYYGVAKPVIPFGCGISLQLVWESEVKHVAPGDPDSWTYFHYRWYQVSSMPNTNESGFNYSLRIICVTTVEDHYPKIRPVNWTWVVDHIAYQVYADTRAYLNIKLGAAQPTQYHSYSKFSSEAEAEADRSSDARWVITSTVLPVPVRYGISLALHALVGYTMTYRDFTFDESLARSYASSCESDMLVGLGSESQLIRDATKFSSTSFPNLAYEAYRDIGLWNGNGIQYIKELPELGSTAIGFAGSLVNLTKAIPSKKLKMAIKAASQAFLSVHYGLKLTVLDTKELADTPLNSITMKRLRAFATGASTTGVEYRLGYTVYYNDLSVLKSKIERYRQYIDVDLTLDNVWDMIPYSFVIDWFTNIGQLCTVLDNYYKLTSEYEVLGRCQSIKAQYYKYWEATGGGYEVSGPVLASHYLRMPYQVALPPVKPLAATSSTFDHWVEAGALFAAAR